MSDAALRRTVRRCLAVLVVVVSLLPMMFVARIRMDYGRTHSFTNPVLSMGDELALGVLLCALAYLVGSSLLQFVRSSSAPEEEAA
ncbi:hypothetical protein [Halolamina rubra]|uniref:hypothetical protein n=1 Tax=Halolamina rubra TaxID=1380430 RepID=UPI000678FDE3|nr:hypothetical protein [Halolamina rubra]